MESRAEEQRDGSAFHCKFVLEIGSRCNGIGGAADNMFYAMQTPHNEACFILVDILNFESITDRRNYGITIFGNKFVLQSTIPAKQSRGSG